MGRKGLVGSLKHFTKVKKSIRKGWKTKGKSLVKEGKKIALREGKKLAYQAGKSKVADAVVGGGAATLTGAVTENPFLSAVAGGAAIEGKDYLVEKYLGTKSSKHSTHSGKNYAVKRKPAVRFNNPSTAPRFKSSRLIKDGHVPGELKTDASKVEHRNVSHITSGPRPTGSKM